MALWRQVKNTRGGLNLARSGLAVFREESMKAAPPGWIGYSDRMGWDEKPPPKSYGPEKIRNQSIYGGVSMAAAVITLVFLLSQQLRKGEFLTLSRIGASKPYLATLIASEIGFVFIGSLVLAAGLTIIVRLYALQILQLILGF